MVEGGVSKQILSQFDGPVTFNENVRISNANKSLTVVGNINIADTGKLFVNNETNATSATTGAIVVKGGVGVAKDVFVGGNLVGDGASNLSGFNNVTATAFFGDGAGLTDTGATLSESTSNITERVVLTDKTSGTMTTAKTDSDLTFNFSTNKLTCGGGFVGNLTGNVTGNVTGNLTGNADTATTATNVVGAANRILFNNATNTTTTSSKLTFDGNNLEVNDGDLITGKFIHLNGTATNSGDIHTAGGHDGIAVIQNTSNNGKIRIAGKGSSGSDVTVASFDVDGAGTPILRCDGDIVAFNSSDRNLKENITVIPNALDKINAISGNTFTWKSSGSDYEHFLGKQDTGVIAQEVEALGLPGITTTRDDGTKAVRYDRLIPILIQAVKELSAKVTALEGS